MITDLATPCMPDFSDPAFKKTLALLISKNMHLASSYMLAVTALTLGMDCTFKRTLPAFLQDDKTSSKTAAVPTVLEVGNGSETEVFFGSMPISSAKKSMHVLMKSKIHARRAFASAGVPTPIGGLVWPGNTSALDQMAAAKVERFLLKPNKGSLAKGVLADVSITQAKAHVAAHPGTAFIVEQYIVGTEYRVFIANGEFAGWFAVLRDHVVGNGRDSIDQLRQNQLLVERANPYVRHQPDTEQKRLRYMRDHRIDGRWVPKRNETVWLSQDKIPNWHLGVHQPEPATNKLKRIAKDAARSMGTDFAALDVLSSPTAGFLVLEANARPGFTAACFPVNAPWNLRIPEAILSSKLTVNSRRVQKIEAFDFLRLVKDYLAKPTLQTINAADYIQVT